MHGRQRLGAAGERIAADHLRSSGLLIRDRNWRTSVEDVRGELDIIAVEGPTLVLVEVRTRTDTGTAAATASVGWAKRRRLRRLAAVYLQQHPHDGPVRGDVVAIAIGGGTDAGAAAPVTVVRHLRGVW